jgi:predicted enzyme related to lactoylglutathione lyase
MVSENEAMWQVAETGWIYVVGDANRAGKAVLTLLVDDLEDHVAELGERGLATSAIETVPGLYRKAVMTDPEGNRISLGEDLSTDA